MKKLSVALGLRDKVEKTFTNMIADMSSKFKNDQGKFTGGRHTYEPVDGKADDPTKRGFKAVESTVEEQLDWFTAHTKEYLETVFSVEATNASGVARADIIVDGSLLGNYSSNEILRLKSVLDRIRPMIKLLPIRPETEIWVPSTAAEFTGRRIFENRIDEGFATTTDKRTEIVNDPHIKDSPNRPPVSAQIDTKVNIGKYTKQNFSGAITNRERAEMEVKVDKLYSAVVEALEKANHVDIKESDLGLKAFDYLF